MKFSLITSFFNTAEYVDKLYNSILSQTYQNWEWIVTDDFSENSAKEKLLEINKKDSRVKYVDQNFKQEVYYNPHKFSSLDSSFVMNIGSDDILYPKILEVYKHFFMLYPDVICMASGATRYEEDGSRKNYLFGDDRYLNNADHRENMGSSEAMFGKNIAWRHIPYPQLDFNPNNKYQKRLEDLNLLLRLEEIGKLLILNRNLCDTDVRSISLSNSHRLAIGVDEIVTQTQKDILGDTDIRRNNKSFYSMKKPFVDEFQFVNTFYYGNLCKSSGHAIVNLLNPSISYRQQDVLKELYFDLEFRTDNFCPLTGYNYFLIQSHEDVSFLEKNIQNLSTRKNLIIVSCNYKYPLKDFLEKNFEYVFLFFGYNNLFWVQFLN